MEISDIDAEELSSELALLEQTSKLRVDAKSVIFFRSILLERRWISYHFTPIYNIGLDLLSAKHEAARQVIRRIIREEYPNDRGSWKTPSHREDLMTDLRAIGASDAVIAASKPSKTIKEHPLYYIVSICCSR